MRVRSNTLPYPGNHLIASFGRGPLIVHANPIARFGYVPESPVCRQPMPGRDAREQETSRGSFPLRRRLALQALAAAVATGTRLSAHAGGVRPARAPERYLSSAAYTQYAIDQTAREKVFLDPFDIKS